MVAWRVRLRFPWARRTRSGSSLVVHEVPLSRATSGAVRVTVWLAGIEAGLARSAGEEDAVSELGRLEAAVGECREMIREAHAATKDLRAAVREARQEVRDLAADEVAARIQAEVSRQLEELGERTGEAVTAATQKVLSEFDRFGESLLGKEAYWQKASGRRAAARPDTDVVPPGILPGEDKS